MIGAEEMRAARDSLASKDVEEWRARFAEIGFDPDEVWYVCAEAAHDTLEGTDHTLAEAKERSSWFLMGFGIAAEALARERSIV